jgi:hypothetical protein
MPDERTGAHEAQLPRELQDWSALERDVNAKQQQHLRVAHRCCN